MDFHKAIYMEIYVIFIEIDWKRAVTAQNIRIERVI